MSSEFESRSPVDSLLDQIGAEPVPRAVEDHLRLRMADLRQQFADTPSPVRVPAVPIPRRRLNLWYLASGAALVLMALIVVALPGPDAWAQVQSAINSRPWIRATIDGPEGTQHRVWFSPERQLAAAQAQPAADCEWIDLRTGDAWSFRAGDQQIVQSTLSHSNEGEIGRFEFLLKSLGQTPPAAWRDSQVELRERSQRTVVDGDRTWLEFLFRLRDPRQAIPDYQLRFQVDPETRLPAVMTVELEHDGQPITRRFVFDFPQEGPVDIYALGAPAGLPVFDRRAPQETRSVIQRAVVAESEVCEPYTAVVLVSLPHMQWRDILEAYRVRRTPAGVTVEVADLDPLLKFRMRVWSQEIVLPAGEERLEWWKTQIAQLPFQPVESFDGHRFSRVVPDRIGRTLAGEPGRDDTVQFEGRAFSGPAETSLLRVQRRSLPGTEHAYWISPRHGYNVVRSEVAGPQRSKEWINTTVVDEWAQSPQGHWYATASRHGVVERTGDDLKAETGVAPVATVQYRYLVDFD